MERDREIELMRTAGERLKGRVRHWLNDPEIRAALQKDPRKAQSEAEEQKRPIRQRTG